MVQAATHFLNKPAEGRDDADGVSKVPSGATDPQVYLKTRVASGSLQNSQPFLMKHNIENIPGTRLPTLFLT